MKRTLLFTFIFAITLHGIAQPICDIKEYTIKDGLAQSIITGLLQDQKGFMWFSTWDGLNKFDGYTFKKYKSIQGDGSTITNNRMQHIAKSKYGDIWCLSYLSRVYLFDSNTEKFIDVLGSLEEEKGHRYNVRKIRPLAKGVAWILCSNGYCFRVDEKAIKENKGIITFSTFNHSIKGENIYNVIQDTEGDEWVFTNKGITIVGNKEINSDFPFQSMTELNGEIWLTRTNGKLARYDRETSTPQFIELPEYMEYINAMEVLDNRTFMIGSNKGIVLFDTQDHTFTQIDVLTPTQQSNFVTHIYKDRNGEFWLFTQDRGVIRFDINSNEIQHLYTPKSEIAQHERKNSPRIFEDAVGTLWILPNKGNLSYYNRESKKLEYYYTTPGDPTSAFHPYMRHIYIDKQGNIWFASTRGVNKISSSPPNYEEIHMDQNMEIRAFLRDSRNNLWIASKSGTIRIFDEQENFKGYLSKDGKITQSGNLFQHRTYCFMEDQDENIWIGTRFDGIYLLKKNKGAELSYTPIHYTHNPEDPYSPSSDNIYSIYQDNMKRIWVGCYHGGINLVSKDEQNNLRFIHRGNLLKNYPTYALKVRYITQVGDSVMMAGTTDGLLTFSSNFNRPEEIKFYCNVRLPKVNTSISSNDVMQIYANQNNIYLATFSGGINKIMSPNLLSENIEFKAYTERNGLTSDLTLSIAEDQTGNLWIVSENALTRFNPQTETFENYDQQFLPENVYFSEAIPEILASGKIVFGTNQGIVKIIPDLIKKSDYAPLIALTNMRVQDTNAHPTNIDHIEKLKLTPKQRDLTLQFAALDFNNNHEIRYAYRLKGLEEKWNYADKSRSASYLNIPKGKYDFEVKSTNSDGVWVDNIRTLQIEVLPTFWETGWAWLLYFMLFNGLIFIIVYVLFYIYRLRHRVDMEQQLSNIKLRFFTDISHELRTPLMLISSPVTEVLEHEPLTSTAKEHLTLVQRNTSRMLELINQILDFRKIQNKKMKVLVEKTEIVDQLSKIASCFQLIAKEKQISFGICNDIKELYLWVDKDKFEKIFYNLLSNAFKYTPAHRSITIKVTTEAGYATISIVDEGIGIQPQKLNNLFQRFETLVNHNILQASSGIGLSLVKELVELHHGSIDVTSKPGEGSEFCVRFLTGSNHFKNDKQAEFILSDTHHIPSKEEQESPIPTIEEQVVQESEQANHHQVDKNTSVLIVEDNEELRNFLNIILSRQYTVLQATNGEKGLEKVRKHVPDLIISDVMMPVMDGLDMVKEIKKDVNICHIPIILLSTKSALDDRIKGLESGIDDYITKPFSATYLNTRINMLLKQRKLLQERYMAAFTEKKESTLNISPSEPKITPFDEVFLKRTVQLVEENIDNTEMTIDEFANALQMSRTVFYRKLKTIVGLSPVDFIREIRVKRAVQLIESGEYTFSQIAYMCGFNDPKYFTKCFKKQMGVTPTEYREKRMAIADEAKEAEKNKDNR